MRYNSIGQLEEFGLEQIVAQGSYNQGGYAVGTISLENLWSLNSFIEEQGIAVVAGSLLHRPIVKTKGEHQETLVN